MSKTVTDDDLHCVFPVFQVEWFDPWETDIRALRSRSMTAFLFRSLLGHPDLILLSTCTSTYLTVENGTSNSFSPSRTHRSRVKNTTCTRIH